MEASLKWFDDIEVVLDHMGCPLDLLVHVTGGVIRRQGQI